MSRSRSMSRKSQDDDSLVHLISMENPFGEPVWVVPSTSPRNWLGETIRLHLVKSVHRWSQVMSAWIIDYEVNEHLVRAVEEGAGHDEPWCAECMDWLEDSSKPLCSVWKAMESNLEDTGFEFWHVDDEDEEEDEEEPMPGFRVPESLRKLFTEEGSELNKFLQARAKAILRKQASAVGIDVPEPVLDEMFEAMFNAAKGRMGSASRANPVMSARDAAAILGVTIPTTEKDVIDAYRKKARETHPDMVGGSDVEKAVAAEAFKRVVSARETLMRSL